jgi:response regulator RpfG family c-di-GMP phosphodiesterase
MKRSSRKQLNQRNDSQLTPKVLVVDDVDANLKAMEALLESLDCELVLAQSGNEALKHLLKHEFAVLLLDVQMPDMDGYEVAHHARKNPKTKDVPILFLTATTHTETNVLKGYGAGAVDYLFKPIDATILRGKIRVFLDLYRSQLELKASNDALSARNDELRQAHEELMETQAQLVHSAKMASISGGAWPGPHQVAHGRRLRRGDGRSRSRRCAPRIAPLLRTAAPPRRR